MIMQAFIKAGEMIPPFSLSPTFLYGKKVNINLSPSRRVVKTLPIVAIF